MTQEFDIVIFGGFGDLSLRKLLPALYRLEVGGHFNGSSRIFLTTQDATRPEKSITEIKKRIQAKLKPGESIESHWQEFSARLNISELDVTKNSPHWTTLEDKLNQFKEREKVFYLAMPPKLYRCTCELLGANNIISSRSRVVLEKPLGYDQKSAKMINQGVGEYFPEEHIFRIDHYLGKETVQNLLALRFANELFEPLWNSHHIDHVQISISEEVGLEGRIDFYDQAGAMRDMVQNHLLQLLCLVAMEPPHKLQADNIRTEKLKVLQALRPILGDKLQTHIVRGQYVDGTMNGKAVPSYQSDLGAESQTETFVAIKAHIDNWRWSEVPFYLRTGKRMRQRCAEIVIQFKSLSHNVFDNSAGKLIGNRLVIRLQPDEGIQLTVMAKKLNEVDMRLQQVPLNLNFAETFDNIRSDAYQRLLLNVIQNDLSLFGHVNESALAWAWVDPIISTWAENNVPVLAYEAGTWGPDDAAALLHRDKRAWHNNDANQINKKKPV